MKYFARVVLFIFILLPFSGQTAEPQPEYQSNYSCGVETQLGFKFNYCIRNVDRTKSKDIIYFFHGLAGNEETWFTQKLGTGILEQKWHFRGYDPTIVTISFGEIWLLVNNHRFPLLPYFKDVIVPFLENKIGGLGTGKRMLIGESMGGLNAVEASLQLPNLFFKVALLCPAITTLGPFASKDEIADYIKRTGAKPAYINLMLSISKQVFINQKDWDKHDPLKLLLKYPATKPKFYISTGLQDEYGLQEGSAQFNQIANQKKFKSQWIPIPGGHCSFDRRTAANFIMEGYQNE